MTFSVVGTVILAYGAARPLLNGVITLVRNAPWILAGRTEATVIAVLMVVSASIDLVMQWQAVQSGVGAQPWVGVLAPLIGGLVAAVVLSRRGHFVFGVHDHDFRDTLANALRDGGYTYEVRVDGRERPSAVILSGLWNGVEVAARSRTGTGTLRGTCDGGRFVEQELAERMRATFDRRDAEPHIWSAVTEIAVGFAGAVLAVWIYL